MESGFSLPIPGFRGGSKFISVFAYVARKSSEGLSLLPPHAMVSLDGKTGKLIEYSDFVHKPPFGPKTPEAGTPIGAFPHPQIKELSPKQYAQQREKYNLLVDQLSSGDELSDEFKKLFAILMEPAFATYYWAIASPELKDFMTPAPDSELTK